MTKYVGPKLDPDDLATQGDLPAELLSGAGAPDAGLGSDGDFYIDTTADALYGPKSSGSWGAALALGGSQSRAFATFIG